jgi:hypothetical protein
MGLEKTIRELKDGLGELSEKTKELGLTMHEDQPKKNRSAAVDKFEYATLDLEGWLGEALEFADSAQRAASHPTNIERVRHDLGQCQDRFRRIDRVFSSVLFCWEAMKELTAFADARKGEWPSWAASVGQGIAQCRQPLENARDRLSDTWQEIAERVVTTTISVTTNIGQKADEQTEVAS